MKSPLVAWSSPAIVSMFMLLLRKWGSGSTRDRRPSAARVCRGGIICQRPGRDLSDLSPPCRLSAWTSVALAFEPVGLWPLMPLASPPLRAGRRAEASARRCCTRLAVRRRSVRARPQLDRHRLHLSGGDAGLARLGRGGAAELYLAVYPALATGLAWRFGQRSPLALVLALAGGWALTEWLRATMFTGFAWNPVGVSLLDTFWRSARRDRHLRPVDAGGAARRSHLPGIRSQRVAISHFLLGVALLVFLSTRRPRWSPAAQVDPGGPAQHRPGSKWREGLEEEAFRRLTRLSRSSPGARPDPDFSGPKWPSPVAFQLEGPPPARRLRIAAGAARRTLFRPGWICSSPAPFHCGRSSRRIWSGAPTA